MSTKTLWQFLTLDKPTVYELANKGFNIFASINPAVAGGFEHQGYFALIDQMVLFVQDVIIMVTPLFIIWGSIKKRT